MKYNIFSSPENHSLSELNNGKVKTKNQNESVNIHSSNIKVTKSAETKLVSPIRENRKRGVQSSKDDQSNGIELELLEKFKKGKVSTDDNTRSHKSKAYGSIDLSEACAEIDAADHKTHRDILLKLAEVVCKKELKILQDCLYQNAGNEGFYNALKEILLELSKRSAKMYNLD